MYFPQQPGVGGRMYFAGTDPARPPFGQDWANAGWNGVPQAGNIPYDPNQPVPEPPRANQPNNAGTMPGAASPSSGSAAQQIQAWREAHQGIHKQRWGGLKGNRQPQPQPAPAVGTNRLPPPTTRQPPAPVGPPVPSSPTMPPGQIGGIPGQSGQYGGINPGGGMTGGPGLPPPGSTGATGGPGLPPPQNQAPIGGIPGQSGQYGGINPGGKPQQAGMQLSAMKPWGKDQQL